MLHETTTSRCTPAERFLAAARGETTDRAPVWLMRQAGRYLPEYQAVRREHSFVTCCTTPELSQEISLQPWRRFGMDGVIVFTDILMPLAAMGLDFSVDEGVGPILSPAVRTADDARALRTPDATTAFAYLATTLRGIRSAVGNSACVIGFCGAPWTVATYMVNGGKGANQAAVRQHLLTDHVLRTAIFERLVPLFADYLTLQVQSGAQVVQIFDSWGGALTREEYDAAAAPALHALIERVHRQTNHMAPIIVYCQPGQHLLETFVAAGADVVSVDWRTPLHTARECANAAAQQRGRPVAVQGNLDPDVLLQDAATVRERTRAMLIEGETTGYIANLGHGVVKTTPVENVQAFVETVKNSV